MSFMDWIQCIFVCLVIVSAVILYIVFVGLTAFALFFSMPIIGPILGVAVAILGLGLPVLAIL